MGYLPEPTSTFHHLPGSTGHLPATWGGGSERTPVLEAPGKIFNRLNRDWPQLAATHQDSTRILTDYVRIPDG